MVQIRATQNPGSLIKIFIIALFALSRCDAKKIICTTIHKRVATSFYFVHASQLATHTSTNRVRLPSIIEQPFDAVPKSRTRCPLVQVSMTVAGALVENQKKNRF
jgi:hypothetical protein